MEHVGTIFGVIIAIIVIVSWIKNLDPKGGSSLQNIINRGIANVLGEQNSSTADSSDVKIYDEYGNLINFQNNTVIKNSSEDVVIYDEDGNVMSPGPPLNKNDIPPEKTTLQEPAQVVEEAECHADMYHDFIRSNGSSAIVIQEILGKPAALR